AMTTTPPAALKTNVLRRITTVRQEPPPTTPVVPVAARAGRRRALARFALAACLAAALGSGGIAVWQHQQAVTARGQAEAEQQKSRRLADVLAAPDAKVTTGHLEDNATGTLVVTRSLNQAAFLASGLPRPPSGKVYQLWYDDSGTMRSAGLLNSARTSDAVLLTGPLDQASAMGITVEPTGGSTRPTSAPLALMPIPRA
ncbi:anti-sigma factor, partial [Streptomyces sp. NPDC001205]